MVQRRSGAWLLCWITFALGCGLFFLGDTARHHHSLEELRNLHDNLLTIRQNLGSVASEDKRIADIANVLHATDCDLSVKPAIALKPIVVRQLQWSYEHDMSSYSQRLADIRTRLGQDIAAAYEVAVGASQKGRIWYPSHASDVPPGALLPHMRLPPAFIQDLPTTTGSVWDAAQLSVPPDGLCFIYCWMAAQAPEWWQQLPRDSAGFILEHRVEAQLMVTAQYHLGNILELMHKAGLKAS
jgi:hypothetical protein